MRTTASSTQRDRETRTHTHTHTVREQKHIQSVCECRYICVYICQYLGVSQCVCGYRERCCQTRRIYKAQTCLWLGNNSRTRVFCHEPRSRPKCSRLILFQRYSHSIPSTPIAIPHIPAMSSAIPTLPPWQRLSAIPTIPSIPAAIPPIASSPPTVTPSVTAPTIWNYMPAIPSVPRAIPSIPCHITWFWTFCSQAQTANKSRSQCIHGVL